jgi:hypothetical protein
MRCKVLLFSTMLGILATLSVLGKAKLSEQVSTSELQTDSHLKCHDTLLPC